MSHPPRLLPLFSFAPNLLLYHISVFKTYLKLNLESVFLCVSLFSLLCEC